MQSTPNGNSLGTRHVRFGRSNAPPPRLAIYNDFVIWGKDLPVKFAKGPGFDVEEEFCAWSDSGEAGFREAGYAYARLEMVRRYGIAEARQDAWGDLFLCRQGRLQLIYAAKQRGRGGAVVALYLTDMRGAKTAEPFEREARRRLKEIGTW